MEKYTYECSQPHTAKEIVKTHPFAYERKIVMKEWNNKFFTQKIFMWKIGKSYNNKFILWIKFGLFIKQIFFMCGI